MKIKYLVQVISGDSEEYVNTSSHKCALDTRHPLQEPLASSTLSSLSPQAVAATLLTDSPHTSAPDR